jgi:ATP adenylyltransferase
LQYLDDARKPASGCPFCPPPQEHTIVRNKDAVVFLNCFPSAYGHLLVASRFHASYPSLVSKQRRSLLATVDLAMFGLQAALEPDGMNIGLNVGLDAGASIPDHAHWHLIPRWRGDHNFLPVVADVKSMPELLEQTAKRLRPFFKGVGEI